MICLLRKRCGTIYTIVWVKGLSSLRGAGRAALSGVGIAHLLGLTKAKLCFAPHGDSRQLTNKIKEKRSKIEYELPRLVANVEKTLKHNRSLLSILTEYSRNAGPELKHELDITIADMNSGNAEAAITRLEARVGSSMMSDVCRGFIGMIRGDSAPVYWSSLAMKFSDIHRQRLRLEAQKIPKRVKKLSMSLLFCFMLIYVVVILAQIMGSVGVLFG